MNNSLIQDIEVLREYLLDYPSTQEMSALCLTKKQIKQLQYEEMCKQLKPVVQINNLLGHEETSE